MYIVDHTSLISSYNVEMFERKVVEKSQHICYVQSHFYENHVVYEIMWKKYVGAGQATEDNIVHTLCMLDN